MIDPIAIQIGPFAIHWYGIFFAIAAFSAAWLATVEARRRGEDADRVWSVLLIGAVGGIIGARTYHVIHEWDAIYRDHLELIPQVWNGGIGVPGGIAGGVLAIFLYTRRAGVNFARWLDIAAPAMLLAQAIGRLGNFVNQELYGPPTDLPWGIPIDAAHRVPPYLDLGAYPVASTFFHPLFAYEAILNVIGMFVLLWVGRRFATRLYDGDIALMYLLWYPLVRTFLETFRSDNWVIGGIPTAIIIGVITAVAAGSYLVLRHVKGWGTPGAWITERQTDEPGVEDAGAAPEPQPG